MITRVILKDFSNFEAGRSNNGGRYGFYEEYSYIPEQGMWLKSYHTTSEFEYCSACGVFVTDHCSDESRCPLQDCEDCGRLPCAHKVVSSEQALLEVCRSSSPPPKPKPHFGVRTLFWPSRYISKMAKRERSC